MLCRTRCNFVCSNLFKIKLDQDGIRILERAQKVTNNPVKSAKVLDMAISQDNLYITVDGNCISLETIQFTNIVKNSPLSSPHGVSEYKEEILFTDVKSYEIKHYSHGKARYLQAMERKPQDGPALTFSQPSSFSQPTGLCTEMGETVFVTDAQVGSLKMIVGLNGTKV